METDVKQTQPKITYATMTADRRFMKMSLSPVFNNLNNLSQPPVVLNPLLPGSGDR